MISCLSSCNSFHRCGSCLEVKVALYLSSSCCSSGGGETKVFGYFWRGGGGLGVHGCFEKMGVLKR